MQVTLVPEVQAHLVFLEGGGFTVVIPPGHGFTLNVNAADIGAGGAGAAGAGGAGAAVAAGEAIAAITAGIEQHSTENTLSTTQILHMLMIDNTYEVLDIHLGAGAAPLVIRYRRGVAPHPHPELFPHLRVVSRRYHIEGQHRFLLHYLLEHQDDAGEMPPEPLIPLEPVVPIPFLA
ncbi:hypothetical protein HID58_051303 [Brassica napus]|uniref:Uncharacterized protein n=1 Tax=Brassica napus TaxID=3708 RepID=A0ABQ8A8K6_BRANA|nr:hypothetical protein HID58_051303 [Brassica napus]